MEESQQQALPRFIPPIKTTKFPLSSRTKEEINQFNLHSINIKQNIPLEKSQNASNININTSQEQFIPKNIEKMENESCLRQQPFPSSTVNINQNFHIVTNNSNNSISEENMHNNNLESEPDNQGKHQKIVNNTLTSKANPLQKISFKMTAPKTISKFHLPSIKNIHSSNKPFHDKNLVPIANDPITEEENIKKNFNQEKFAEYHNRNLDFIKKVSEKFCHSHQHQKQREETSMERFNKIKKFFNCNLLGVSEELNKRRRCSPSPVYKMEEKVYYYSLTKGNNSELIKKCLNFRLRWKDGVLYDRNKSDFNLIWTPTSGLINFGELCYDKETKKIQVANHYENHGEISNKLKLFENVMSYCENHAIDVFEFLPMTILFQYESIKFLNQFNKFTYLFNNIENFLNKTTKVKYKDYFYVDKKGPIGYKTNLYIHKNHYDQKNIWLIKAINLNRGRCIKLIDSVEMAEYTIKNFYSGVMKGFKDGILEDENKKNSSSSNTNINGIQNNNNISSNKVLLPAINKKKIYSKSENKNIVDYSMINSKLLNKRKYQSSVVIMQKYIEKPLLYNGRKVDMRIWVLLNHDYKIYIFKEGHLKASSVLFDINSRNSYVHITNYSVQKYNENFSKFEIGNEISFESFENSIREYYGLNINIKKDIFPKLKEIIIITMKSIREYIVSKEKKFFFEIFGYDFMFDVDLNPFLIEVNTNPGLEISSPLISIIVPRMIDDCLRLTIDPLFKTDYEWGDSDSVYQSQFRVTGYGDQENLWDFVYDLNSIDK